VRVPIAEVKVMATTARTNSEPDGIRPAKNARTDRTAWPVTLSLIASLLDWDGLSPTEDGSGERLSCFHPCFHARIHLSSSLR
jgi:hypothetical protein